LNVCLITTGFPPENGGGIGTYIYNLSKGLVALGHTVHVISPAQITRYREDSDDGVTAYEKSFFVTFTHSGF
jgi:glycosyltransferase involved in cell wall biosynthesis